MYKSSTKVLYYNNENPLLGVVALCARMRTSLHTNPLLSINCPKAFSLNPYPKYPLIPYKPYVKYFKLVKDQIGSWKSSLCLVQVLLYYRKIQQWYSCTVGKYTQQKAYSTAGKSTQQQVY
jgi:hypothetical protein